MLTTYEAELKENLEITDKENVRLLNEISDLYKQFYKLKQENAKHKDFYVAVRDPRRYQKGGMPMEEAVSYWRNKAFVDKMVKEFTENFNNDQPFS